VTDSLSLFFSFRFFTDFFPIPATLKDAPLPPFPYHCVCVPVFISFSSRLSSFLLYPYFINCIVEALSATRQCLISVSCWFLCTSHKDLFFTPPPFSPYLRDLFRSVIFLHRFDHVCHPRVVHLMFNSV